MSKFNTSTQNVDKTTNISGRPAFKMNNEDKLITQVLTSFFNESKYYGDNSKEIVDNIRTIARTNPKFIANLAIFTRNEMHMRTISHVLTAELANEINGKPYARKTINKVVERVDDMTEILSYILENFGKPIPNSVKKGLGDTFKNFNEYALAKYNRDKKVTLKDILCLSRPTPNSIEQSILWKKVLEDNLETPITWETELSAKGNTAAVWERLILEKRLGYMAMMRNLRNILKAGVSDKALNMVYSFLSNKEAVLKNKQLPFRYYSAYNTIKKERLGTSKIYDALESAIKISTYNITPLKGKTLIAADVSGSMTSNTISSKSQVTCAEIAVILMALANYICEETITTTFDDKLYMSNLSTTNGIIANANSINCNGGGTDITLPLKYAIQNKIFVDRIIILSDNEINSGWDGTHWRRSSSVSCQALANEYKNKINPNVWIHAIDLEGYGTQQFKGDHVNILAGWNEKILEYISLMEEGNISLRNKIEGYYFK